MNQKDEYFMNEILITIQTINEMIEKRYGKDSAGQYPYLMVKLGNVFDNYKFSKFNITGSYCLFFVRDETIDCIFSGKNMDEFYNKFISFENAIDFMLELEEERDEKYKERYEKLAIDEKKAEILLGVAENNSKKRKI